MDHRRHRSLIALNAALLGVLGIAALAPMGGAGAQAAQRARGIYTMVGGEYRGGSTADRWRPPNGKVLIARFLVTSNDSWSDKCRTFLFPTQGDFRKILIASFSVHSEAGFLTQISPATARFDGSRNKKSAEKPLATYFRKRSGIVNASQNMQSHIRVGTSFRMEAILVPPRGQVNAPEG